MRRAEFRRWPPLLSRIRSIFCSPRQFQLMTRSWPRCPRSDRAIRRLASRELSPKKNRECTRPPCGANRCTMRRGLRRLPYFRTRLRDDAHRSHGGRRGEAFSSGRPVSQMDHGKRLLRAQPRLSSAHREMDNASQLARRLGSKLYVAT